MSSDGGGSLVSHYEPEDPDQDGGTVGDPLVRFEARGHGWDSRSSDSGRKLDDLLRPAAVHPLFRNAEDASRSPRLPSIASSSLASSSVSSFTDTTPVRPTPPPPTPALHRLNHLKSHMKQLKRLYRQEIHQEELARRDMLLQTLCTSGITLFRHCASQGRFPTAVRALLYQYLPAINAKLFEVEQFDGRVYLVDQTKGNQTAAAHAQEAVCADTNSIEITQESVVSQWSRLGVAGRAAVLVGSAKTLEKDDNGISQLGDGPPSPTHAADLECIGRWGHSVAEYIVQCPNNHLVLQIPASKLLESGLRPEYDLSMTFSTRGSRRRPDQKDPEMHLLVAALRGVDGNCVGVLEAVIDSSAHVSVEFLDAFGVLLASAIEMRRNICRSTIGELDVQIRRRDHANSSDVRLPVLRVPLMSKSGDWELAAFNNGAVLECIDSTLLHAIKAPLKLLLAAHEARAREIELYNAGSQWIAGLWARLRDQPPFSDVGEWQQSLRTSLLALATNSGNYVNLICGQTSSITNIRVLFQGESADSFRNAYRGDAAIDHGEQKSLDRDFVMLQQAIASRQNTESSLVGCAQLASTVVAFLPSNDSDRLELCESSVGILVRLSKIEDDDSDLLQAVKQYLLPVLSVAVQVYAEFTGNRARVLQLENELRAAVSSSEHYRRECEASKTMMTIVGQLFAAANVDQLVESVNRAHLDDVIAMKLFVVDKPAGGDHYRIWTIADSAQAIIGSNFTNSIVVEDVVRIVETRHRVGRRGSSVIEGLKGSPRGRCRVVPLFPPGDCCTSVPLGVVEFEFGETSDPQVLLPGIAPFPQLLAGILDIHSKMQSSRSTCENQVNSLLKAHSTQWSDVLEWVARWSFCPIADNMSLDSWCEQAILLCRELVPSADFVNVFLFIEDGTAMTGLEDTASSLQKTVTNSLRTIISGQSKDEDIRCELSLFNQCVLGAIKSYPLTAQIAQRDQPLGIFVASKKNDNPFTKQETQLLQIATQLLSTQAAAFQARQEACSQIKVLNSALDQRSKASRELFDAHASISKRARQLYLLLEVSRLALDHPDGNSENHTASSSKSRAVNWHLQSVLLRLQDVLNSTESRESICALAIDRIDQSQLLCSVIDPRHDQGQTKTVLLGREFDDAGCWFSTRRRVEHTQPFTSLPQCILPLLELTEATSLLTIAPVLLFNAPEPPSDTDCAVLLLVASHGSNGLAEGSFIDELAETIADLLRLRLEASEVKEDKYRLSAKLSMLESQRVELLQDYRLLDLANIVWMEVVGSASAYPRGSPRHIIGASNTSACSQSERPITSLFRNSFFKRIVPFLREELRICAVELVLDFGTSNQGSAPRRASIDYFIASLDPSRGDALRATSDSVLVGSDIVSSIDSTSRTWLVHRFVEPDSHVPQCYGLFYIEWELHSPSANKSAEEKAKKTLLWLSDWLQTLAQYCYDQCSIRERIQSADTTIHTLLECKQAQTQCLDMHEYWKHRWASMVKFVHGIRTLPTTNVLAGDGDEPGCNSDWNPIFTESFELNDVIIWGRGTGEGGDFAWTVRRDGTRDQMSWSELSNSTVQDPGRFQFIVPDSSTTEALGVVELVTPENRSHLWSNEHAKIYREVLALSVGSCVRARYQERTYQSEQRVLQKGRDYVQAEFEQSKQQAAQSWTVLQQIEELIHQLHHNQDSTLLGGDNAAIRMLFGQIERILLTITNDSGGGIVQTRILLQTRDDKGNHVCTSCDEGCTCQTPALMTAMLKHVGTSVCTSTDADGSAPISIVINPLSDSLSPVCPGWTSACSTNCPREKEGDGDDSMLLLARDCISDSASNYLLLMCARMTRGSQTSVTMSMLKLLCSRLMDAISHWYHEERKDIRLRSTEQQLAAVDCEMNSEQRRSKRITTAMSVATKWISNALSSSADTGGMSAVSAVEEVLACLAGGTIEVVLMCEPEQCEYTGATVSLSRTTGQQHPHSPETSDKTMKTHDQVQLPSVGGKDAHVKCRHSSVEGLIDEVEIKAAGARIVVTSPDSSTKADLSLLWRDQSVLALVVNLVSVFLSVRRAKDEALAQQQEGESALAVLQSECTTLKATCLETTSALHRSDVQLGLLRAHVKGRLEPIPTQAAGFVGKLISESCDSREAVIQVLGDGLSKICGVESIAIRERIADKEHLTSALYSSSLFLIGGKQPLAHSKQVDRIVGQCIARQETEFLSLKATKGDTSTAEVNSSVGKRWLAVIPFVTGGAVAVLLVLSTSEYLEHNASRKNLYQIHHAQLLCRLASWRLDQLATTSDLVEQVKTSVEDRHGLEEAVRTMRVQLDSERHERCCYQQMVGGVTHDMLQAMLWSDKMWQKALSWSRKVVSVWKNISDLLQDRISTRFVTQASVRVMLYGILPSKGTVFHLSGAATEFTYSTIVDLAGHPSTRRLWSAIVNPDSLNGVPIAKEKNGVTTLFVPMRSREESECYGHPVAVVIVTIAHARDLTSQKLDGGYVSSVRDLSELVAPFAKAVVSAVRPKSVGPDSKGRHRDGLSGKQRLQSGDTLTTTPRGHLPTDGRSHYNRSTDGDEFDSRREPDNQMESIEMPRQYMRGEDEEYEEDQVSLDSIFSASQSSSRVAHASRDRLLSFLLMLQQASDFKQLQRLVTDELKEVWSGRFASRESFELVDMKSANNTCLSEVVAIDSVHCTLLPKVVLNEVLRRLNSAGRHPAASPPRLWKFVSGREVKRAPCDEFWVAGLFGKASTLEAQVVTGLFVIRGLRLESTIGKLGEGALLSPVLQCLQQQLSQIRRSSELEAQITESARQKIDFSEQAACLAELKTRHRHLEGFSELAVHLSTADSERELVRATTLFLRDFLPCRRVEYEPNQRHFSTTVVKTVADNQEVDESVVPEQQKSHCDDKGKLLADSVGGESAFACTSSSTAVEVHNCVKLRVFSAVPAESSSRLVGTFSAHLDPVVAPSIAETERQNILRRAGSLINASFHRLQAIGSMQRHEKCERGAALEFQQLHEQHARLDRVREQQQLSIDALQQRYDEVTRVNSSIEEEVVALRLQLQLSEERRVQCEESAICAQQQLAHVAAAADKALQTRDEAGQLQKVIETQQERLRVLQKRSTRRKLQAQQLVNEVSRLKQAEELDKLRIAELEKQLAVAQQRNQSVERYAVDGGTVRPARAVVSDTQRRRRVSAVERHVDRHQERERRVQKLKQMRLAEELRCLAALEVREISSRQGEQEQIRRVVDGRSIYRSDHRSTSPSTTAAAGAATTTTHVFPVDK